MDQYVIGGGCEESFVLGGEVWRPDLTSKSQELLKLKKELGLWHSIQFVVMRIPGDATCVVARFRMM